MDPWLSAAAVAAFATFFTHAFAGGRAVAAPLLAAQDLRRVPKLTAYYCWHMVTLLLFGMALSLAYAALVPNAALALMVFGLCVAFTLLSLGLVVGYRVSPLLLPQWVLFALIAALMLPSLLRG